jgi:hypothetical protein
MFMSGVRWRVIRLSLAKWHIKAAETQRDRIRMHEEGAWSYLLKGFFLQTVLHVVVTEVLARFERRSRSLFKLHL